MLPFLSNRDQYVNSRYQNIKDLMHCGIEKGRNVSQNTSIFAITFWEKCIPKYIYILLLRFAIAMTLKRNIPFS